MNQVDAIEYFFSGMLLLTIAAATINWIYRWIYPLDDTDKSEEERSGLIILVDHATGLQYLATEEGGLTPRLDAFGKHMRQQGDNHK